MIKKLDDTANYVSRPGHEVIPGDPWNPLINSQWMQEDINEGAPFKVVSPRTPENMIHIGGDQVGATSFGLEIWQLKNAGRRRLRTWKSVPSLLPRLAQAIPQKLRI